MKLQIKLIKFVDKYSLLTGFRCVEGGELLDHLGIFVTTDTIDKVIRLSLAHGWDVEIAEE